MNTKKDTSGELRAKIEEIVHNAVTSGMNSPEWIGVEVVMGYSNQLETLFDSAIKEAEERAIVKTVNSVSEKFDEWWYAIPAPRMGKVDGLDAAIKLQQILDSLTQSTDK